MACVEVGSDSSQKLSFHFKKNLVATLAASFYLLSLQLVVPGHNLEWEVPSGH